jgi:excisionase family DNA binding protein
MKYRPPPTLLPEGTPLLLRESDLVRLLAVTARTVRRWRHQGRLRAMRLGEGRNAALRYSRVEIERFLAEAVEG